ncbi:YD repeat-containing protein [Tenacibaculum caenipelagi]|uniref:YD repeat-containing protein n=2 Tax=Tenacibaculum caenipelagi TaxID=1325435 RepID=A0A4R6TGU3_9FLAO|nr:YD repeat-containing protein [Tenacibaculum caenipelagi]
MLSILAMLFCVGGYAQELPDIIPPSPIAYELGKYGANSVGMFTGTPNIDIPLYNYSTKNLSVPISLSYNSNGVQVDQISTNVGLGWSLNAGGTITRVVKGQPDEESNYLFPEDEIKEVGHRSPMALDFFYEAGNSNFDTEKDIFMYNFMGNTGKFILDNEKKIVLIPKKDILMSQYYEEDKKGFKAILSDGTEFYFLEEEISMTRSSGAGHEVPGLPKVTAWYLSKIIHPKGDVVYFKYETMNYSYDQSCSESMSIPLPTYQSDCKGNLVTGPGYSKKPVSTLQMTITGKRLTEISSNNTKTGKILFNANETHPIGLKLLSNLKVLNDKDEVKEDINYNYVTTTNSRVFLSSLNFKTTNKDYAFEYDDPQGLPVRLSASQDYWGYYNGKSNSYYFPNPQNLEIADPRFKSYNIGANKEVDESYAKKGLLKKITYPTKGSTLFEYESNTYYDEVITNPSTKDYFSLSVSTNLSEKGEFYKEEKITASIPFSQEAMFTCYVNFNSDECSSDLLKSQITITIKDNQTGENILIKEKTQYGNVSLGNSVAVSYNNSNNEFYVDLIENHSYTVTLVPSYFCTKGSLNLSYYTTPPYTEFKNVLSGGLRVKRVSNYTSDNNLADTKRYYYGKKETFNESSGEKSLVPYYFSKQTNRVQCEASCSYYDVSHTSLVSSSLRSLFASSGNQTTYYKYVTVSYGGDNFENGGEEHEYIIHNDVPGYPVTGDVIQNSTWVNTGWDNGFLKKKTIFKKKSINEFLYQKEIENNYIQDTRINDKVYGYTINKKFNLICTQPITYKCKAEDLTKVYKYKTCTANHSHHWYTGWLFDDTKCIASGANNTVITKPHPCYAKEVGYVVTKPDMLENLDIMEYSVNSYWGYLSQTTEKQYDNNGLNPVTTTTNYFYDNPNHLQQTRTEVVNSQGEALKTETQYAHDVNDTRLIREHRIAEPLEVKTYKNTNLLSYQRTEYDSIHNPSNLYLPEIIQTSKGAQSLEDRIVYHSYDDKGNPTEVSKADGTHIVYIWGYQQTQPVAKIEDVTLSQVSSYVSNIQTKSNVDNDRTQGITGNEGALRSALNNLRSVLPNAQVTTFTYDPLIGVTSITDPRGQTVYYEYDEFNRLEFIKDADGNLLKENKYNYKN